MLLSKRIPSVQSQVPINVMYVMESMGCSLKLPNCLQVRFDISAPCIDGHREVNCIGNSTTRHILLEHSIKLHTSLLYSVSHG